MSEVGPNSVVKLCHGGADDNLKFYKSRQEAQPFASQSPQYLRFYTDRLCTMATPDQGHGLGTSSTCVVEMVRRDSAAQHPISNATFDIQNTTPADSRKSNGTGRPVDVDGSLPVPNTAVTSLQKWNHPRINVWRVFATFGAFTLMGANDAAYGVSFCLGCV